MKYISYRTEKHCLQQCVCVNILAREVYSPWARYRNPPALVGDNDFWIAQYVSFQYLLVCKMNYSAFRDYLRWYIAA